MQAQIEIRRTPSQAAGLLNWLAAIAVVVALLSGIGYYAATAGSRAAAPAQATTGQVRSYGDTQQPQHGNLSGDDGSGDSGSGAAGAGHGQLP